MKTKTILMIALAAVLGGGAIWIAPHSLLAAETATNSHKILYYTCPMHPSVKTDKPGDCPICGMKLMPVYDNKAVAGTNAPPNTPGTNSAPIMMPGCCSSGGCH